MSWTTPEDLKGQLARLWARGELLRPLVTGDAPFPLRLTLKGPTSAELTHRFQDVRAWAALLESISGIRLEWREVQHRVQGRQRLPDQAWMASLEDAWKVLGRRRDAERFGALVAATRRDMPELLPWLARRPLSALALEREWPLLVGVVAWLRRRPRPGVYLRQVEVPGGHSKFIEAHRGVLAELFDLALAPESVRAECRGTAQFSARYGFLDKPTPIRFRLLDDRIHLLDGPRRPDLALDADSFAQLDLDPRQVFITENETNFLAFPQVPGGIVIFGAGYGWEALAKAAWLKRCALHYWGDIDTHGFAILDRLRVHFGHVASCFMDRETLLAHEVFWDEEPDQVVHDLPRLEGAERDVFDALRHNRIRSNLRLEQERVGYGWLLQRLERIVGAPVVPAAGP
jgi:hypothetical protein